MSTRYNKGLDWIGAILSTVGLGLLVCDLACVHITSLWANCIDVVHSESTSTPKGWATRFVPSLFGTAIVLLVLFVFWEIRREARNESVLLPMSIWTQPGVKMGPVILLVFFAWWGFNTLSYFVALFFQEVQMLNPLQTAVRLVPMGISVSSSRCSMPVEMAYGTLAGCDKQHRHGVSGSDCTRADTRHHGPSLCIGTISKILYWRVLTLLGLYRRPASSSR